ncbi:hypothetical protein [Kordiimonas aquimaris]|uniref:hypothetical protein n=1 Tax=Kordiimonas aquimaris TaxID=707591 RepID=UPI0021D1C9AA|nr:hypothetical protein [Kordiimonas aquimaris]
MTQRHNDFDGPGHPFANSRLPFLLATFIEKGMNKVYENQTMPQVALARFVKNGD